MPRPQDDLAGSGAGGPLEHRREGADAPVLAADLVHGVTRSACRVAG